MILYREYTARRDYDCGWECGAPIKAGTRYAVSSLTPNDGDIGNTGWWNMRVHGRSRNDCPDRQPTAPVEVHTKAGQR